MAVITMTIEDLKELQQLAAWLSSQKGISDEDKEACWQVSSLAEVIRIDREIQQHDDL